MPTSLTATKIKDTYGQVLHVDGGITSTPKLVYDGDGTATALKVSTTDVQVNNSPVLTDADIGSSVQAYDADLTAWSGKTAPTGTVVGTSDTQTLSNKTFSTNPTISAGTANGVAYLNGSKVLTTGSALTFDGANLAMTGGLNLGANNNLTWGGVYGANIPTIAGASNTLQFYPAGSTSGEQMRLTSTGLGIGTSSPGYKLDIANASYQRLTTLTYVNGGFINARTALSSGTYNTFDFVEGSTTTGYLRNYGSAYGAGLTNDIYLVNTQAADIVFGTSGAERMRLDASGNLGLGVTPSAWTTAKAIDIGPIAGVFGDGYSQDSSTGFVTNAYRGNSAVWYYKTSAAATYYRQNQGAHAWFTAPSGTAGNAISFTQALTLTANGNLLLGGISEPSTGKAVLYIANAATVPSTNPSGGGVLYVEAGALKYRGSSGTITTLGAA